MKFVRISLAILMVCLLATPVAAATPARNQAKARRVHGLIDLNHATLDQLKTLPGIEDANAAKIVKNRPYANKTQLSTKGVISAAAFARIKALVIAKH
jgi:DNA uptake protein ComE-like DNA-binding protein